MNSMDEKGIQKIKDSTATKAPIFTESNDEELSA